MIPPSWSCLRIANLPWGEMWARQCSFKSWSEGVCLNAMVGVWFSASDWTLSLVLVLLMLTILYASDFMPSIGNLYFPLTTSNIFIICWTGLLCSKQVRAGLANCFDLVDCITQHKRLSFWILRYSTHVNRAHCLYCLSDKGSEKQLLAYRTVYVDTITTVKKRLYSSRLI